MIEQLSLHWREERDLGQDNKNNYSIILNKFLVFQAVLLLLSLFKENGKVKNMLFDDEGNFKLSTSVSMLFVIHNNIIL